MIGAFVAALGIGITLGGFYLGAFSALLMIVGAAVEVLGPDHFLRKG